MARRETRSVREGIEVKCAFCGCEGVTISGEAETACPGCERRLSVHVEDRFTLVENDGWAVTVSLDG